MIQAFASFWMTGPKQRTGRFNRLGRRLPNDPVVFWVPVEDSFRYGFVFKQDNNGSTFVVSPVPMPWYEDA
jgi:hypothetical protein